MNKIPEVYNRKMLKGPTPKSHKELVEMHDKFTWSDNPTGETENKNRLDLDLVEKIRGEKPIILLIPLALYIALKVLVLVVVVLQYSLGTTNDQLYCVSLTQLSLSLPSFDTLPYGHTFFQSRGSWNKDDAEILPKNTSDSWQENKI